MPESLRLMLTGFDLAVVGDQNGAGKLIENTMLNYARGVVEQCIQRLIIQ